jgi:sortase A
MLAVVSLPSVQLEVPLYSDTSELHLNRGVGLIQHTSAPGKPGNLGIAGHRDGFFRVLERVKVGDTIEVRTRDDRYIYRVTFTSIVYPSDARLLASTASPAVTLVTCYPFRFVGKAPQRFVVRGELVVAST